MSPAEPTHASVVFRLVPELVAILAQLARVMRERAYALAPAGVRARPGPQRASPETGVACAMGESPVQRTM
jgi:hypothetical protein